MVGDQEKPTPPKNKESLTEKRDPIKSQAEEYQRVDVAHEISLERIDINALWVVRRLRTKEYDSFLTGGCVRDLLLGLMPKDFDIATSAKPEEVKRLFRNCRLVGRRFLLAHVFFPGGKIIETATFRANPIDVQDDLPEDILVRRDNVFGSIEEDARRRDFTINGLFYDPVLGKVIDHVGGRKDLEAKIVRSIGDPEIRFQEDPVRILRAVKFATRLGFSIESQTFEAMKRHSSEIVRCAPARLQEEVIQLLTSGKGKESLQMCREIGILDALMPELVESLGSHTKLKGAKDTSEVAESQNLQEKIEPEKQVKNEYFYEMLGALDQVCSRDCEIATSVAFASLLLPSYLAIEASDQNERNWIDRLCINWAERIRLTRRDQDRIRLLLSAVQMFSSEKLQQKTGRYMIRKPWFREALLLFILDSIAQHKGLEAVGIWKALADEAARPYKQERHSSKRLQPRFRRRKPWMRRTRRKAS